jgi:voltage-gated potassium channel
MEKINERNNFLYLTVALLVLLLALPLLQTFRGGMVHWITQALIFLTLLVTYASLNFGRWWRGFVGLILLLMVCSTLLREFGTLHSSGLIHLFLVLVFFSSVCYAAGRRVLLSGDIDSNKIIGGIAVYLLLGLLWSMLYLITIELLPGAFDGIVAGAWEDNFFNAVYFSFVTLTTLGYGDITPTQPLSKALAYLQAITGTFYMAVVVASLIGARFRSGND